MKWVAWHNGQQIPDTVLSNIINMARHGHMTDAAKNLSLVPDTRYGRAGDDGLKLMKSTKKRDCMTLGQFIRRSGKTRL